MNNSKLTAHYAAQLINGLRSLEVNAKHFARSFPSALRDEAVRRIQSACASLIAAELDPAESHRSAEERMRDALLLIAEQCEAMGVGEIGTIRPQQVARDALKGVK
jgi:hypothetical protein